MQLTEFQQGHLKAFIDHQLKNMIDDHCYSPYLINDVMIDNDMHHQINALRAAVIDFIIDNLNNR